MGDTTKMEVDESLLKGIEKEEENIKNLLDKAKETIKAVKQNNNKIIDAAKQKAKLELVKPKEALKAALLYKRALKAKKRHLGIEPEPKKASKVKFYIHIRFLTTFSIWWLQEQTRPARGSFLIQKTVRF